MGLTVTLAACGGGGGDGSASTTVPPADNSASYQASFLKTFAETTISFELVQSLGDVALIGSAGETGACPAGGTMAYDSATHTSTLNNCVLNYPVDNAYKGSLTSIVGNGSVINVTAISNLQMLDPQNLSSQQGTMTSGTITGTNVDNGTTDTTNFSGSVNSSYSGASTYSASSIRAEMVKNTGAQTLVVKSGIAGAEDFYSYATGTKNYTVKVKTPISIQGQNHPASGVFEVTHNTPSVCSPMLITYKSNQDFDLSCKDGTQVTNKKWVDADVQTALAAAHN